MLEVEHVGGSPKWRSRHSITPARNPEAPQHLALHRGPYTVLDIRGDATAAGPVLDPAVVGCIGLGPCGCLGRLNRLDVA